MPDNLVYRVHSDRGGEFVNRVLADYLKLHAMHFTTTQGYDPSSNGSAESGVGYLKRGARYLLSLNRLPTRWWGVAVLAAAHQSRAGAGRATPSPSPQGALWHEGNGQSHTSPEECFPAQRNAGHVLWPV